MSSRTHKAWRLHAPDDLRLEEVATPQPPAAGGVVVRIEGAMVLSYMNKVMSGAIPYALPPLPFVPGTNAVGVVEAVGANVVHLNPGMRVFLSPHMTADERVSDPAQILIGLTAMGSARADGTPGESQIMQDLWRDGVFAEKTHWPAAAVTPLGALADAPTQQALALAKIIVPYGGLLRGRLHAGQIVIINGATGYYGSAAVMAALAMGASRVIAAGRTAGTLDEIAKQLGPRVKPVVLAGEVERDIKALREASDGADLALDLLGQANDTATTLAVLRALRRGGRLVLMGSANAPLQVSFGEMLSNNWEVVGNFMYPKDAPAQLIKLASAGLLDVAAVQTKRFALADLPQAIDAASKMRGLDMTMVAP